VVSPAELPTVSITDLAKDGVVLLDVREDDEWAAGHAPGAKHIPLGDLPARVEELAELPENQPVHVVCRSGGRSARATAWLNASGWDAVNVAGGMKSWQVEGRDVISERPDTEPEIL
jgi:rhodanese-related sulfurtransferase